MLIALEEFEFSMAAIKAVIVVPILAPKINGTAFLRLTIFWATMGTTREVVMVDERIAAVVKRPQKNDFQVVLKNK